MTHDDTAGARRRHTPNRPLWIATALVAGSLVLAGCATGAPSASSIGDSSSSASTTITTTTEDASTDTSTAAGADATTTSETISSTAAAGEAFLATLSDEQVDAVTYDYDDETKSTSWSNFPVTFVERAGLNLADLTDEQKEAALGVLEALLSDDAYATATGIMAGDQYLRDNSSSTEESLGQYYIAFFGDPSDTGAWAVQFGGHHLGINADLNGAENAITFAPTHLGVQPAVYADSEGEEVQPFAAIYETAFAFYDSLTDEQKASLYQGEEPATMACAPGGTCDYPTGTGLLGADLTDEQKDLLLAVIANWAGMADEETNAAALAEIEATLDETYVTWSGATVYDMTQGDGISFQISGPDVYIEFAAQNGSAGADVDGVVTSGWGHVHTIYRDPSNDYGGSVEQQEGSGPGAGAGAPPAG
ncbi:DUF3500 domain-containing protein [Microbacterium sp.]|uniref:DUF3500 domain-containing protein n=1 Tax=Microbacterium sp. TaxID=51671 RepID=UPI002810C0C1|nr:DUF3500 domain-containing protein [Microbacterium sp.]